MSAWTRIYSVAVRETGIWRKRPIYLIGSLVTLIFCSVFFISFFSKGLPDELPIGIVDLDNSSLTRNFTSQLEATQLGKTVSFDSFEHAREAMQSGKITSFVVLPEGLYSDVTASRQPTVTFYVNGLYFVGGALAYQDILTMLNLTNGAVQRKSLQARGVNENAIMGQIKPIEIDTHKIGNPLTNYSVSLVSNLIPGILQMIVIMILIYSLGAELKYGTSRNLMQTAGGSMTDALAGKLLIYTVYFTALGVAVEILLYHWLHFPIAGSLWNMVLAIFLMVVASECLAVFIVGLFPVCRFALSIGALTSMLALSLTGFTMPVEVMPPYIQGFSAIFPLRHYFLFETQEVVYGAGFAGWWQQVVSFLLYLFLPFLVGGRLKKAYILQNYSRN